MKTQRLILLLILIVSLNSCKTKSNKDKEVESATQSTNDTVEVLKKAGNKRAILYKSKEYENYKKFIGFQDGMTIIGNIKSKVLDGRYYTLDRNNDLRYISYFINNQLIYKHDLLKNDQVFPREANQIDSSNIIYIKPPYLKWESTGGERLGLKIASTNYPIHLARFYWNTDNVTEKGECIQNLFEESVELRVEIIKRPAELTFEYLDITNKVIKRYKWNSEDKDKTFKEIPL